MTQKAAKTGLGPTTIVAIEQHFPEGARIINDELSYRIQPFGMRAYVWLMRFSSARDWMVKATEKKVPGLWALVICRKRYIDDKVADFLGVYGWRVLEHLGYEELAERYVKQTGRNLVSMALERIVYAEKL